MVFDNVKVSPGNLHFLPLLKQNSSQKTDSSHSRVWAALCMWREADASRKTSEQQQTWSKISLITNWESSDNLFSCIPVMGKIYLKYTQIVSNYGQIYRALQQSALSNVDMPQWMLGEFLKGRVRLIQGAHCEPVSSQVQDCLPRAVISRFLNSCCAPFRQSLEYYHLRLWQG